ncbi:MAG: hypothetical protein NC078_12360 [Ruminococcus sp.]|nr:hypothetical protein [Ruminococcus sp.]
MDKKYRLIYVISLMLTGVSSLVLGVSGIIGIKLPGFAKWVIAAVDLAGLIGLAATFVKVTKK